MGAKGLRIIIWYGYRILEHSYRPVNLPNTLKIYIYIYELHLRTSGQLGKMFSPQPKYCVFHAVPNANYAALYAIEHRLRRIYNLKLELIRERMRRGNGNYSYVFP